MSWSTLSASFEYVCHGSTVTINIFTLLVLESTLERQILMSKLDPRAVKVNHHDRE